MKDKSEEDKKPVRNKAPDAVKEEKCICEICTCG